MATNNKVLATVKAVGIFAGIGIVSAAVGYGIGYVITKTLTSK